MDNLEGDALVRRTASKKDGRGVDITLTRKGREASTEIAAEQAQIVRNVIRNVSTEEAGSWVTTLERITTAIAHANREFRQFCLQCDAYSDDSCILVGGDCDCPYLRAHEKSVEQRTSMR